MTPVLDDDLPRLRDDTSAARAMAASAAGGGTERLGREVDPMVMEASLLADRHSIGELAAMVRAAVDDQQPVLRRAFEVARHRVVAAAITDPPFIVREMLGVRPPFVNGEQSDGTGQPTRDLWDNSVAAVALYRATHYCRSSPSDNPTNEMIGLCALAPDREAWERVDALVGEYMATVPRVEMAQEVLLGPTIELEM
jgi:hypothetical protein